MAPESSPFLRAGEKSGLELIRTERISDEGLKSLAELKSLEEVGVQLNPGMTMAGLRQLSTLPRLKLLIIYGGKELPPKDLEELKTTMPEVKVRIEP